MRYRIVIEIEADAKRTSVNSLANEMKDLAVQSWCNPVYVATEVVGDKQRNILAEKD